MNKNKGFTLIELLVVIAIIGILSSVVLASLNTARDKGKDASAKGSVSSIRAEAEIFYDNSGTYVGVCSASGVAELLSAAGQQTGNTAECAVPASGSAWAAEIDLNQANAFFCVDSTGAATTTGSSSIAGGTTSTDYVCGSGTTS